MNKKLTGSFYTAQNIADYMVSWALGKNCRSMLEPSFGDGIFLDAAIRRFNSIHIKKPFIFGVEIQQSVFNKYFDTKVEDVKGKCCNFLAFNSNEKFDAIVGNPPYVSFRNLSDYERKIAIDCAAACNVPLPSSASLWASFIAHATKFLSPNGSLALVLPFELTYVKYARTIWDCLSSNFGEITVVRIHEDIFPDVNVETILLLASHFGNQAQLVNYNLYLSVQNLNNANPIHVAQIDISDIHAGNKPFLTALLSIEQKDLLQNLRKENKIHPLISDCKFNIGYVCADKKFFHPTDETIRKYEILPEHLIPCVPNSKSINGGTGVGAILLRNTSNHKLYLPLNDSHLEKEYLKKGVEDEVPKRYKCQQRKPWYITPSVQIPQLILTVFGDLPKIMINDGEYAVSNSLLAGIVSDGINPYALVCSWYNSLTLLSIELNIHSLGGGVLVLIPGETDKIEIPQLIDNSKMASVLFDSIDSTIKQINVEAAYNLGDEVLLKQYQGFTDREINLIKDAISRLRYWRIVKNRRH